MTAIQKLLVFIACIFVFPSARPEIHPAISSFGKDNLSRDCYQVIQISFVPNFGTNNLACDSVINDISINILAGSVYEVRSFEIGSLINIVQRNSGKCELAGIGNFVGGQVNGLQCAGIINTAGGMTGLQIAGLVNRTHDANGLQIAGLINQAANGPVMQISGLVNNSGDSATFQLAGLINNTPSALFQLSGLSNNSKRIGSFQAAGLLNNSEQVKGLQLAGLLNNTSTVEGLQMAGLMNTSKIVNGSQIAGLINRATYVKGVQIGVINIADSIGGVPVGLINLTKKNGFHQFEVSTDELFNANVAFRSGVRQFYSIVTAGVEVTHLFQPRWTYGCGFGTSTAISQNTALDVDVLFQNVAKGPHVADNFLYKFDLGIERHLFSNVSLYLGGSYNFLVMNRSQKKYAEIYPDLAPYSFYNHNSKHFNLRQWIGFKAGLRFN